jgi:hypothetical protein
MALALDQYADLAAEFQEDLDDLETFDVRVLDVARDLAMRLLGAAVFGCGRRAGQAAAQSTLDTVAGSDAPDALGGAARVSGPSGDRTQSHQFL